MQDTERAGRKPDGPGTTAERVLTDYLRKAEASPAEDGDTEAKAASMAKGVADILSMKAVRASVMILDGTPIVRVRMRSRSGKRTVTAGMDAFAQLADPVLNEMPRRLVLGAVLALREALREQADVLQESVSGAVTRLTSDPEYVAHIQAEMAAKRARKVGTERENLVSSMLSLLADGWTRDMLLESVNIATCSNVMQA